MKRTIIFALLMAGILRPELLTGAEPSALMLDTSLQEHSLAGRLSVLEDASGTMDFAEALKRYRAGSFTRIDSPSANYGFSRSAWWAAFSVRSTSDTTRWLAELDYTLMDHIELHSLRPDGTHAVKRTGYRYPLSSRDITHRNFIFRLNPVPGEETLYLFRFRCSDRIDIPVRIYSEEAFFSKDHLQQLAFGIYYGMIFIMIIYNFLLYFSFRDRSFLFYVLYLFSYTFFQATQNGLVFEYLIGTHLYRWSHYIHLSITLVMISGIQFSLHYLHLKDNYPLLHRILRIFQGVLLLVIPIDFIGGYTAALLFSIISTIVVLSTLLTSGTLLVLKRYTPAYYYMAAWAALLLGGCVYALRALGVLSINTLTTYAVQVGSALEAILLSLGLSARINLMRAEKEKASREIIELQQKALSTQIQMNDSMKRFVPGEFLSLLDKSSITEVELGDSTLKNLTILFADIRQFTRISETLTPHDTFNFLNGYLMMMGPVIREYNGFIDKYIGDAIMALFTGEPIDSLRAAVRMQRLLLEYNACMRDINGFQLKIGIGIHRGDLILGTIGEFDRLETTVIADAVNVASRLETLTKSFGAGILISDAVWNSIPEKGEFNARYLGKVTIFGHHDQVPVWEVYDACPPDVFAWKAAHAATFSRAAELYSAAAYTEADEVFRKLSASCPDDKAIEHYLEELSKTNRT